jgi:hypothetical protein
MIYDNDLRIELSNGVVSGITGPVPAALQSGAATAPAAPAPAVSPPPVAAPGPLPPATAAVPELTPATMRDQSSAFVTIVANPVATAGKSTPPPAAAPVAPAPVSANDTDGALVNQVANPTLPPGSIAKLVGSQIPGIPSIAALPPGLGANPIPGATASGPARSPLITFAIGLASSTVFLTVVLKIAFMRKDFPVIWRDLIFVAFVSALFYNALNLAFAGNALFDFLHFLQADQMLVGVLLLVLIIKFTEAKQFHTAAGIAVAAIAVNTVLGIVVTMFLS